MTNQNEFEKAHNKERTKRKRLDKIAKAVKDLYKCNGCNLKFTWSEVMLIDNDNYCVSCLEKNMDQRYEENEED